jgi:methylated-DNA-[protein]-cysteine S-methyltransferase
MTNVTPELSAMYYSYLDSPIGRLLLTGKSTALTGLYLCEQKHAPKLAAEVTEDDSQFDDVVAQLGEYFRGSRLAFDLPLAPTGTEFQKRVWQELLKIPYGYTQSYGALAKCVGNPAASRAVGLANGRNPISIIVPCHRVIGANGSLTGYGGGLEAKKWLLEHESNRLALQSV